MYDMKLISSRRGLVGWGMIFASFFAWIIVITMWYQPSNQLDLTEKTTLTIALWWTAICGACAFIGLYLEKSASMSKRT